MWCPFTLPSNVVPCTVRGMLGTPHGPFALMWLTEDFKVKYEPWNLSACCLAPCALPPSQQNIFFSQGNITRQKIDQWTVRNNIFLCDNKYIYLFDTVNNSTLIICFSSFFDLLSIFELMHLCIERDNIYKEKVKPFIVPISMYAISSWAGRWVAVAIYFRLSCYICLLTSTEQKILSPFLT